LVSEELIMHDILKDRVLRKLQALPQEQVYQVLDYIEFLETKYARDRAAQPDALQKFAERVEDSLRMRSVAPKVISGTVGLLGTAHRVMRTVSDAGRGMLGESSAGRAAAPAPTPTSAPARPVQALGPPAAGPHATASETPRHPTGENGQTP
jgi:hypothetical protein